MAQLHRGIRGVQDRPVAARPAALLAALALAAGAVPTRAQDRPPEGLAADLRTGEAELEAWARDLGSPDRARRERAVAALSGLEGEALPAVRARLGRMAGQRLGSDETYDALRSFRHVLGSRRADDMIDIAPGVPRVLEDTRDERTVAVAERVLLLRSLERIGSLEAGKLVGELFATDTHAWRWEMRRTLERMGKRLVPALITLRGHRAAGVRTWARRGIEEAGMAEPGIAVQQEDNALLADLLRAYGEVKEMAAMPAVVSFTTHDRAQVREAARWATEAFGRNAIWQLRRVYRNLTEEDADRSWSWRQTMEALYAAADHRRLAPVRADLEAGQAALARGDLEAMRERFDRVLARAPALPSRAHMAPGYAALGARASREGRHDEAARSFQRAVWLAPEHPEARAWRAELSVLEGARSLSRGVVDLAAYEEALALAPGHPEARRALEALSRDGGGSEASGRRRWAALLAALLLLGAAGLLLRRRRTVAGEPAADGAEVDQAPDTLPG